MTVREILIKCSGNMNVYIYDDNYTYRERVAANKVKTESKTGNDEIFDREVEDWHISSGDLMVKVKEMQSFIVSWHASGYEGTFKYLVVANSIGKAKEIWAEFVKNNSSIAYSWEKAEKAVKYHYGGYIDWKDNGFCDKEIGCYDLGFDKWNTGSDHLND